MSAKLTEKSLNAVSRLKKCTRKLELAFQSDRQILLHLYQEDVIDQSFFDALTDPKSWLTPEEKAAKLVAELKRLVELDIKFYHMLVQYMQEQKYMNKKYESILQILNENHTEQRVVGVKYLCRRVIGCATMKMTYCYMLMCAMVIALAISVPYYYSKLYIIDPQVISIINMPLLCRVALYIRSL